MRAWKRYAIWTIVVPAVIGIAILALLGGPPGGARVTVGVGHQFTQVPTPRAMELLEAGAPAEKVLAAVDQSSIHPDNIIYFDTPILYLAVLNERADIVIGLLERGADPNNDAGIVDPLTIAISSESPALVGVLLEAGAIPNGTHRLMGRSSENAEIRRMFEELSQVDGPEPRASRRDAERRFTDDDLKDILPKIMRAHDPLDKSQSQ
jgi:hypothetical protein